MAMLAVDAIEVVRAHTGWVAAQVRPLPAAGGGAAFEVTPLDGGALVLRFARADEDADFAGARLWGARLPSLGVPVPALRAAGLWHGRPYLLHERPAGTELASAYPRLRAQEKRGLARALVRAARALRALPARAGFGLATDEEGGLPFASWAAFVRARLAELRARRALVAGAADAAALHARLESRLPAVAAHLAEVAPRAFLPGSVVASALVDSAGALVAFTGIDRVGYGDPLDPVGSLRAALAARGFDVVLADFWCEELELAPAARRAVDFYTALAAAELLADARGPDGPLVERLRRIVADNLRAI